MTSKPRFSSPRHGQHLCRLVGILLITLCSPSVFADTSQRPSFAPWPQEYKAGAGTCVIGSGKRIVYEDKSLAPLAAILANDIRMATGATLPAAAGNPAANDIALVLDGKLAKESYVLTVAPTGISVAGQRICLRRRP